jgi:hypothetical protein
MAERHSARASQKLRDALWEASQQSQQTDGAFREPLFKHLADVGDDDLVDSLIAFAGDDSQRHAMLTDLIGRAARQLAPEDEPPPDNPGAQAWKTLTAVVGVLHGSGAHPLGKLGFISDDLFNYLLNEAREQRPVDATLRRAVGTAGDGLTALAESRQLSDAIEAALGFPVEPTGDAVYEFDPPGSHVRTHVDSRDYEIVYHLLLEHRADDGRVGTSELIAHLPDRDRPARIPLDPVESLVLRGRGTIHSWRALRDDEHRILVAVGFRR